jgi:hypothetical protein
MARIGPVPFKRNCADLGRSHEYSFVLEVIFVVRRDEIVGG